MMSWYREIGNTELIFAAAFLLLYVFYALRVIRTASKLKTPFGKLSIKLILRLAIFALLLIALLGPSFGSAKREVKSVGKDIMVCVDLSKSMDAFDIQPTRLEKVKFEMKKIVKAFNSDRIGIIIFSSESFMQCPLTYDQNALSLFIESMNTNLVPPSGTDFTPPLEMAISKIKDDKENLSLSEAKSKVIILISDGEDFGKDTKDAVSEIEKEGIKLFTLGVGTEKGGMIRVGSGLKKDPQGSIVTSKLNSSSLKSLASQTGGEYFEINGSQNGVPRLINKISSIEGELKDSRLVDVSANRYFYPLGLAILLLLIDVLWTVNVIRL